jgi:peroxiredoxin
VGCSRCFAAARALVYTLRAGLLLGLAGLLCIGCKTDTPPDPVTGHLAGRITVSTAVDSTADYSDFRVLVAEGRERQIDTLGHAITARDGRFATPVVASARGIYLLTVWGRNGRQRLLTTEYVVADGDSATLNVEFPLRRALLPVRSPENSALLTYRNTMALHRQALTQRIQRAQYGESAMMQSIRQTSSILWSMQTTYAGTYATQLAAVESLALLEGWNDSLVVARAAQVQPSNPRYVEAARIGRRAVARQEGQKAAIALVEGFWERAETPEQQAALYAVRIRAHLDSLEKNQALETAEALRREHPDSPWALWAERAAYEAEALLPGSTAPAVSVRTTTGIRLTLDSLRGHPVLLEFYRPGDDLYTQQMPTRNALYAATRADSVAFLSISLQPDTLLNQAFFEGRELPGHHVIAPGGLSGPLAETYNVAVAPTRFLIDAEGRIVDKYVGSALLAVQDDLARLRDRSPDGGSGAPPSPAAP